MVKGEFYMKSTKGSLLRQLLNDKTKFKYVSYANLLALALNKNIGL